MEEILKHMNGNDYFIYGFMCGIIFTMFYNIILSLTNYITEKAWKINDYERILYKTYNDEQYNEKDIECMGQAVLNYKKRLDKRKKIDNFFNKFKKGKNNE